MARTAPATIREYTDERDRRFLKQAILYMGIRGFHARTIADVCGLTLSCVTYQLGQMKVRLRDYRDGEGEVARGFVRKAAKIARG